MKIFFIKTILAIVIVLGLSILIESILSYIGKDISTKIVVALALGIILGGFLTWLNRIR